MYNPPELCSAFVLTSTDEEPKLVREAINSIESRLWKEVVIEEMESLHINETWYLLELPNGRNPFGSKCVFKKKMNEISQFEKFKDRLVAKGYSQVEGVDFSEICSPVAKLTSIRVLMYLVATFDLEIEHMDVNTSFLHGDLGEEIYMK
jgi:hypothetical protein